MEKNLPRGNWRKTEVCKISYTYLIQEWVYKQNSIYVCHFSPWGIHKTHSNRQSRKTNFASFNVIPEKVKSALKLNETNFDKSKISITVTNTGLQEANEFQRVYCNYCESVLLPKILNLTTIMAIFLPLNSS